MGQRTGSIEDENGLDARGIGCKDGLRSSHAKGQRRSKRLLEIKFLRGSAKDEACF